MASVCLRGHWQAWRAAVRVDLPGTKSLPLQKTHAKEASPC
jgi:hypothetical protein